MIIANKVIYKKINIDVAGVTLLSIEEAEELPISLRRYHDWWWLRSPGYTQDFAASVSIGGSVLAGGSGVCSRRVCVRPALKIRNLESSDLMVGDRFSFGGVKFEVITDSLAFCTDDIGCCAFNKDYKAQDANIYEVSDVKKFIDNWFIAAILANDTLEN